ncbi:hypothetical protein PTTG_25227, partial [Puccinia triticina 1-1 BBBD Race 1]
TSQALRKPQVTCCVKSVYPSNSAAPSARGHVSTRNTPSSANQGPHTSDIDRQEPLVPHYPDRSHGLSLTTIRVQEGLVWFFSSAFDQTVSANQKSNRVLSRTAYRTTGPIESDSSSCSRL